MRTVYTWGRGLASHEVEFGTLQGDGHLLTTEQIDAYRNEGFLVLRNAIPETDVKRLERGFARNLPLDGTLQKFNYPEPGRYTLANNCLKDPDLAFIVEHPAIIPCVTALLGHEPRLTAYVIYDRTPGGEGIPAHNDYKRWRPVGSSMNWLFTIVPFCDFDDETGQVFIAPGSHRLERIYADEQRALCVRPAFKPPAEAFIDPGLKRGDLLLMNMHLWHRAAPNRSDKHRVGLFNKYAAANAPPATGYFLYDDDVHAALSAAGQSLLGVHSNKPIGTTRLVLLRGVAEKHEVFLLQDSQGRWLLPGGEAHTELAIPDWDEGNVIASLQHNLREQLRIETPWVSYLGDYPENGHLCRVYGYTLTGMGFPVGYPGEWHAITSLSAIKTDLAHGYELDAIAAWLDPAPIRGKGLSQAQSRVDQYAY